jgi:hypothetical protein
VQRRRRQEMVSKQWWIFCAIGCSDTAQYITACCTKAKKIIFLSFFLFVFTYFFFSFSFLFSFDLSCSKKSSDGSSLMLNQVLECCFLLGNKMEIFVPSSSMILLYQ